jgi:hypothetical protein
MPLVYNKTPSSGAIEHIGYDPVTGELRILFRKNKQYPEYIWGGIEPKVIENFFLAGSKGKYYHTWIKGRRDYTVKRALGSFRLSAIVRGVPKAPERVIHAGKKAVEFAADLVLPIR